MKLSIEELNDLKRNLHMGFGIKCYGLHQCDINNLLDTIESQQQEILRLNEEMDSICLTSANRLKMLKVANDSISAQQQEIEQMQQFCKDTK